MQTREQDEGQRTGRGGGSAELCEGGKCDKAVMRCHSGSATPVVYLSQGSMVQVAPTSVPMTRQRSGPAASSNR